MINAQPSSPYEPNGQFIVTEVILDISNDKLQLSMWIVFVGHILAAGGFILANAEMAETVWPYVAACGAVTMGCSHVLAAKLRLKRERTGSSVSVSWKIGLIVLFVVGAILSVLGVF